MSKVAPVRRSGEVVARAVWCPACDRPHNFALEGDGGWSYNGDPESPTFRPSMLATYGEDGPVCHGFVTDGEYRYCTDSTHELAGKTVEVPEWPWPEEAS